MRSRSMATCRYGCSALGSLCLCSQADDGDGVANASDSAHKRWLSLDVAERLSPLSPASTDVAVGSLVRREPDERSDDDPIHRSPSGRRRTTAPNSRRDAMHPPMLGVYRGDK